MAVTVKAFANLGEAAAALSSDRGARFLGGGTLVMRALNEGDVSIARVVRSTDRSLRELQSSGGRVRIGAGMTMAQILGQRDLAALHGAARAVGGPAIRNMATVGGNMFAPTPYGDLTTALLALDASVLLQGSFGAREMPLEEFLSSRDRSSGNVVAGVLLSRLPNAEAFRFRKVSRVKPKGISVLSIAAHLPVSGGRISGVRVAYGAMAPTPIRARAVERALEGATLDEAGIARALAVAHEGTSPTDDAIASAWYRREVLPIHLRRLLLGQPA